MVGRTQVTAVNEDANGSTAIEPTIPELVDYLKSAFHKLPFTRVEDLLLSREDKMKKEIENQNEEIKLLREKFHMEELEKLKLQNECEEQKELASQLKRELDELLKELAEKEDAESEIRELRRKNLDLSCLKLIAETDRDIWKVRVKELEAKCSSLEKDLGMANKLENGEAGNRGIEKDVSVNLPRTSNAGKRKVGQKVERRLGTGKNVLSTTNSNSSSSSERTGNPNFVEIMLVLGRIK